MYTACSNSYLVELLETSCNASSFYFNPSDSSPNILSNGFINFKKIPFLYQLSKRQVPARTPNAEAPYSLTQLTHQGLPSLDPTS